MMVLNENNLIFKSYTVKPENEFTKEDVLRLCEYFYEYGYSFIDSLDEIVIDKWELGAYSFNSFKDTIESTRVYLNGLDMGVISELVSKDVAKRFTEF